MSDPTNPIAPPTQEAAAPAPIAPAAPVATAPVPVATAPATAPRPYLNPYAAAPARSAAAPQAPAPTAPPAVVAEPPAAPVTDPRVDALLGVLGETVAQDLAALPANVAATVRAIAPDSDPVAQRRALNAMRANGLTAAAPSLAPLPAPASTVMPTAPAAPTPAPGGDDAMRLAEYEKLRAAAPTIAQAYRVAHHDSITRALAARSPAN